MVSMLDQMDFDLGSIVEEGNEWRQGHGTGSPNEFLAETAPKRNSDDGTVCSRPITRQHSLESASSDSVGSQDHETCDKSVSSASDTLDGTILLSSNNNQENVFSEDAKHPFEAASNSCENDKERVCVSISIQFTGTVEVSITGESAIKSWNLTRSLAHTVPGREKQSGNDVRKKCASVQLGSVIGPEEHFDEKESKYLMSDQGVPIREMNSVRKSQHDLLEKSLVAQAAMPNSPLFPNVNFQHTQEPSLSSASRESTKEDDFQSSISIKSSDKQWEDGKKPIEIVVESGSSELRSSASSHTHSGEDILSTLSSRTKRSNSGASMILPCIEEEYTHAGEFCLESDPDNAIRARSTCAQIEHQEAEPRVEMTPRNKSESTEAQDVQMQKFESPDMLQNLTMCDEVNCEESMQTIRKNTCVADCLSRWSLDRLNVPVDRCQVNCALEDRITSAPELSHSPSFQLCQEVGNYTKREWKSGAEIVGSVDVNFSQEYDHAYHALDKAHSSSCEHNQLGREDMRFASEHQGLFPEKSKSDRMLVNADSENRTKWKCSSLRLAKEYEAQIVLDVPSVGRPMTARRDFNTIEMLNESQPSARSPDPEARQESHRSQVSNGCSASDTFLSSVEHNEQCQPRQEGLLESRVESRNQNSQLRVPQAQKASTPLKMESRNLSRLREPDKCRSPKAKHCKRVSSLQTPNHSCDSPIEASATESNWTQSTGGSTFTVLAPEVSTLSDTESKPQKHCVEELNVGLIGKPCGQVPQSTCTSPGRKTKLSPYAPEYIRQTDPKLPHGAPPLIAHWRPLNDILAQLQCSRARTPVPTSNSNLDEKVLGVRPEYIPPRKYKEPEVHERPHCSRQSVIAARGDERLDKMIMDQGGVSSECSGQPSQHLDCVPRNMPNHTLVATSTRQQHFSEPAYSMNYLSESYFAGHAAPLIASPFKPYWATYYDLFDNQVCGVESQSACEVDLWAGDFERQEEQLAFARRCQPILREEYMEIVASIGHAWPQRR